MFVVCVCILIVYCVGSFCYFWFAFDCVVVQCLLFLVGVRIALICCMCCVCCVFCCVCCFVGVFCVCLRLVIVCLMFVCCLFFLFFFCKRGSCFFYCVAFDCGDVQCFFLVVVWFVMFLYC